MIPQYTYIYITNKMRNGKQSTKVERFALLTKHTAGVKRKEEVYLQSYLSLKACMFYQLLTDKKDQSYSV